MGTIGGTRWPVGSRLGAPGLLCALALALPAQSDWSAEPSSPAPGAREEHSIASDTARRELVLFGGRGAGGGLRGDTWVRAAGSWVRRTVPGPPARRRASMAFHPRTQTVVLFGGYDGQNVGLADTWAWNGVSWTRVTGGQGPTPRAAAGLCVEPASGDLLLFGGVGSSGTALGDTWKFDGASWRRVAVGGLSPSARFGHRLAADPVGGGVVLFGGVGAAPDTWVFAGGAWSVRRLVVRPGPRAAHVLVADPLRGRLVLHGGTDGQAYALADTWEWDGSAWIDRAPTSSPPPRLGAAMAFDPSAGRCVLFGGFDGATARADTWSYGPNVPASVAAFGAGCAGSAGVPSIRSASGLPWLGDPIDLAVEGLPAHGPVLVHGGLSTTTWSGLALPFPLGPIGMPGCFLLVSVDAVAAVPNQGGRALLSLQVPRDQALRGARVYFQALALDPGANALGAIVSDGLELKFGAR